MTHNLISQKRVIICTFTAIASGLGSAYMGGYINNLAHNNQCDVQAKQSLSLPGLNILCKAWVTPGAILQGSTTGLWMGTVLGAFIAGLATRKTDNNA